MVPHALRHSGGEVELVDLVQSYNGVECRDTLLAGIPGESWVRTRTVEEHIQMKNAYR